MSQSEQEEQQTSVHPPEPQEKLMKTEAEATSTILDDDDEPKVKTYRDIFEQIRKTLGMCWELAGDQRSHLVYGYFTVLAIEAIGTATPWFISRMTSMVVSRQLTFQWRDALPMAIAIYLSWSVWAVVDAARDYISYRFRRHLGHDLPIMSAQKLLSLSRDFHQRHNTAELATKVGKGTANVSETLSLLLGNVLPRVTYVFGALFLLTLIHWVFVIPALLALAANVFLMLDGRLRSRDNYTRRNKYVEKADAFGGEVNANILMIQANGREDEMMAEIKDLHRKVFTERAAQHKIEVLSWAVLGFIANQIEWSMVLLAIYFVSKHLFSAQTFVFVLSITARYRDELFQLGWMYDHFMEMMSAIQKLFGVMKEQPTITDPADPVPLPEATRATVEFDKVSFAYRTAQNPEETNWALQDISFKIEPGTVLGIAGLSGGGKSTILNLLLRLDDPTEGRVLFNGVALNRVQRRKFRERIAYVEQEPVLFNKTIGENIRFGCDCTQEEIEAAAKLAGIHDFIMTMEKGYETGALERGARLSGGQKQRLAMARALVRKASFLILDEPTSSVDPHSIACIMDGLEALKGVCTIVIVSHQLATLQRLADMLIVVRGGKIIERGTHAQLMKQNGLYALLVGIQQHEDRAS